MKDEDEEEEGEEAVEEQEEAKAIDKLHQHQSFSSFFWERLEKLKNNRKTVVHGDYHRLS